MSPRDQNLGLHKAACWMLERGMRDRPVSLALARELEAAGLIGVDMEATLVELARDVVRYMRRLAEAPGGDLRQAPINLTRIAEDGSIQPYWVTVGESTHIEAAKDYVRRRRRDARSAELTDRYNKEYRAIHGRKYAQAVMRFMQEIVPG